MLTINAANNRSSQISQEFSNRFLVVVTMAYIAGIVISRLWLENSTVTYLPVGIFLFLVLAALYLRYLSFYRAILILVIAAAGGFAFFYAFQHSDGGLINYTGFPVTVEGTVVDEPLCYADHTAYRLSSEVVETSEGRFPVTGTLLVKIYGDGGENYWFGERLRLSGTIVEPRGQRNPGGFDYRFYLLSQGIDALIYPSTARVSSLGPGKVSKMTESAVIIRGAMTESIKSALPSPSAELLTAILFGQRHHLPEEVEDNFRRAGVGHLLAVSGLHVGMVATMVLGLWRRLNLKGNLPLVLAIALVIAYAYLTGMRPSALRAALMVSIALGALLLDREKDLPTAVAFAALVTLFLNPLLLFTIGFQLSYAATLALIYSYRPLQRVLSYLRCPRYLLAPLAITLAAQIGVLPLCIYYFQYMPTGALLFNLLLLPLIAFVVGLGLTGALISLFFSAAGAYLLWASRPLLELMLLITALSRLPGFYIPINPPGIPFLLIFYGLLAASLLFYYRWDNHNRWLEKISVLDYAQSILSGLLPGKRIRMHFVAGSVLILAVIFIWSGILLPSKSILTVTFIDVGQGASGLIETPCGAVILVDAGGQSAWLGNPGEIGERVLLPFLRRQGIRSIDLAVITHPHEDHFGGFIPLVDEIALERILISPVAGETEHYDNLLNQAELAGSLISQTIDGQTWRCGTELILEIIGPPEPLFSGTTSDLNNNSIVFILRYGEIRMLFTGDIEDAAVIDLFRRRIDLRADLLLIPHHGGYMEAMPAFLEAVRPSLSIIQVGPNSYGHPHPYIIGALEDAGVPIYRNDHHGAIIVKTDGTRMQVTTTEQPTLVRQ